MNTCYSQRPNWCPTGSEWVGSGAVAPRPTCHSARRALTLQYFAFLAGAAAGAGLPLPATLAAIACAARPCGRSGWAAGAGRACYYLAYRVALLDAVRHVAAGDELHAAEEDQWARGAAVSGEFFPSCR